MERSISFPSLFSPLKAAAFYLIHPYVQIACLAWLLHQSYAPWWSGDVVAICIFVIGWIGFLAVFEWLAERLDRLFNFDPSLEVRVSRWFNGKSPLTHTADTVASGIFRLALVFFLAASALWLSSYEAPRYMSVNGKGVLIGEQASVNPLWSGASFVKPGNHKSFAFNFVSARKMNSFRITVNLEWGFEQNEAGRELIARGEEYVVGVVSDLISRTVDFELMSITAKTAMAAPTDFTNKIADGLRRKVPPGLYFGIISVVPERYVEHPTAQ